MSCKNLNLVVLVLLVCFSSNAFAQPLPGNARDKAVQDAIKAGQDYLLKAQKPDGSWDGFGEAGSGTYNPGGPGAIALYALLESAKSVPEHEIAITDPQIKKGLDWLCGVKMDKTYSLALRASALQLALEQGGDYRKQLELDVKVLIDSTNDSKDLGIKGSYSYPATSDHGKAANAANANFCYDNSNSGYGLLGVWAGARANLEIPNEYWLRVMEHWLNNQGSDGGWSYSKNVNPGTTATMTAGGVASLFVCIDNLLFDAFIKCDIQNQFKPAEDGLACMDRQITAQSGVTVGGFQHYYLYNVERVGLATGRKYFGTSDWYKLGADLLVKSQNAGAWGGSETPVPATAYAILFLVRGQHPVLFNKLQHTGDPTHPGDWNNRPRALANALIKLNEDLENSVSWQIINLQVPVSEWHDAPILVITGSMDPKFTPADIDKLRAYVQQGGMIFSITECGGTAFSKAMAAAYKQMFPDYELTLLSQDHDLYSKKIHFALSKDELKLSWVTNGVRPLVLHTDVDLMLPLQLKQSLTNKAAFKLNTNLAQYVSTYVKYLPHRGTSSWPEDANTPTARALKVAKLMYTGNYDPEPLAWERFAIFMRNDQQFKVDVSKPMTIANLTNDYPLAILTGTAAQAFTQADKDALKKYVAQGGTLFIDAAGGSADFYASAQTMVTEIWGKRNLQPLNSGCEIYKPTANAALAIEKFFYTAASKAAGKGKNEPGLRGVTDNGRIAVIVSRDDVTAGMIGALTKTIEGYNPETAYRIMRNLVMMVQKNAGAAPKPAAPGPAATTATAPTTKP
jgi:hypothetical protein